jgi:Kef-type K+ transport system membrane component KefB
VSPLLASAASSPVGASAEETVLRLLYQLVAILLATRLVVAFVRRVGQTDVSGEILAGLLLGPSFLGALAPDLMHRLFHPGTATIFVGLAQVGLLFLMFQIGQEFEFQSQLGPRRHAVMVVSAAGIAVPFALGYLTAPWFRETLPEPRPPALGFALFFAVAMSITAIPILGRIFMELGLSHTRTATLAISAAAIDDVAGWLLLGAVSLALREEFTVTWAAGRILLLSVYLLVVMAVVRPWLKRFIARQMDAHGDLRPHAIAVLLLVLFTSASVTSRLGVFALIGGFIVGVALHDDRRFVAAWRHQVAPIVNTFFLPIFFAYTGLRTDVGALTSLSEWGVCALVCAVAFAGKLGGAFLGATLVGEDRRSALTIAVCMNTRALMELVVLNVGYDLGVLPRSMFTKLVIMAIASTFMATPLVRRLMRGQEAATA